MDGTELFHVASCLPHDWAIKTEKEQAHALGS
jgi:hypothetical protein